MSIIHHVAGSAFDAPETPEGPGCWWIMWRAAAASIGIALLIVWAL